MNIVFIELFSLFLKKFKKGNQIIGTLIDSETTDKINVYKVNHYQSVKDHQDYDGAVLSDENQSEPLNVYISPAKAVLMDDIKTSDNEITTTPNTPDSVDPCSEKVFLTIQKCMEKIFLIYLVQDQIIFI